MDIFILIVSICMGKSIRNTRGQHQNAYLHSELFVLLQCDGVANKLVQAFVDKDNPEKACEDVGLCTAVAFGKFFTKNKKHAQQNFLRQSSFIVILEVCISLTLNINEQWYEKPAMWLCITSRLRSAYLGISFIWSKSSLFIWRKLGYIQDSRQDCVIEKYFLHFSSKTYVVGTEKNRLNETVLLSNQNRCLNWWLRK